MSTTGSAPATKKRWQLSLDSWAVILAFALALLIRAGAVKHIPW